MTRERAEENLRAVEILHKYAMGTNDIVTLNLIESMQRDILNDPKIKSNGWQPIETAPKDGTIFLAFDGNDTYSAEELCYRLVSWEKDSGGDELFVNEQFERAYFTHWMPLPEPPKEGE